MLVASSSSPSSSRDGAPSLAASCAAGPVPPLEELLLEEPLLEEAALDELLPADCTTEEPPLDELPLLDFAPEELPLDEPAADDAPPDELLLPEELLALETAAIPRLEAATMECDVGPHGSVPVKG